ncbi:argininosuccinate synthase [Sediminitomix flava]|uniref:argininosuccinate synthase n=1 Tax=Sediminitomix flava TaxID=379075 RepID=A0A315Z8H1_SEDFL|nr:argininosuccinate synthase [Sediminitomix flava]PWJ39326.1 argininosuccinate synthase [Sediminitomix flava]
MEKKKAVLAYSGGLDTSFCVKYLTEEKGYEVHTALVQTGGFTQEELQDVEEKAYQMGVTSHTVLDVTDKYYQDCVKYLVFGNVLRYNTYPLSVSAERVFQAMAIAQYVQEVGADYVVHGSTGAGNDQIRFDMIFQIMIPNVEIITPIRDLKLSREEEIDFLKKHGVDKDWEKAKYSINQGIWGTSVGGAETLTSHQSLPEHAYPTQLSKENSEQVELFFEQGELKGINGKHYDNPVDAIQELNDIAAPYGIGRDTHVGDTIIGIKGRVGFEAAAPVIIIKAHHTLEKHTLTKWQLYWKEQLGNWYGMLVHEGQMLDPVMRNVETFLADTQEHVTGKVFVALHPYRYEVLGIESENDLMSSKFGAYGEMNNAWTGEDARGFAKMLANQTMIYHKVHEDK